MSTYTLHELNEYIRRVIALNLPNGLWVKAEIAQIGTSRGHRYLELVEKEEIAGIRAKQSAVLWADQYRRLRFRAKTDPAEVLQEGFSVRLKVKVSFHEQYGLKLIIEEVDTEYTMGQLAISRQLTRERLYREQLVGKNAELDWPLSVQRIAVISSVRAAGLRDFEQQLLQNQYGYAFELSLYAAGVQGALAEKEILGQLKTINRKHRQFDAVVIIRGGGAKLDLAVFDQYELCKQVAGMSLPLICGIGHQTDEPLIDLVAHTALKTPTAVADFLIDQQLRFEMSLLELGQQMNLGAQDLLHSAKQELMSLEQTWQVHSQYRLSRENQLLDYIQTNLYQLSKQTMREANLQLDFLSQQLQLLHPDQLLQRGYSLTLHHGKVLTSKDQVNAGDVLETRLADGVVKSRVEEG